MGHLKEGLMGFHVPIWQHTCATRAKPGATWFPLALIPLLSQGESPQARRVWRCCRKLKKEELVLLKSREVIAVNQDPLGVAGDRVWKQGPHEVRCSCFAATVRNANSSTPDG